MNYQTAQEWYEALKNLAKRHHCESLIQDFEAWTTNWNVETPEQAFYSEYPEYEDA